MVLSNWQEEYKFSTPFRSELVCPKYVGFSSNEFQPPMAIEKIKILGAILELPAKPH